MKAQVKQYLEMLYSDVQGYLSLWTAPDKLSYAFPVAVIDKLIGKATTLSKKRDVYLHVAVQKSATDAHHRGSNTSAASLPGLFHDLDIKGPGHKEENLPTTKDEALLFLKMLPLRPSLIIYSGGGLYPFWLFREPWVFEAEKERAACDQLLKRWQAAVNAKGRELGWKLDSTSDLARLLRLPGTINHKYDPPEEVTILEMSSEIRYNPSDFEEHLVEEVESSAGDPPKPAEEQLRILREKCKFMDTACKERGNIKEPLWFAEISNLASIRPGGLDLCHQFSKGHPKYSERETEAKIWHALNDTGPHTCKYIRENGFDCGSDCGVKSPAALLRWPTKINEVPDHIKEMNAKHAVLMLGGKCVVMNEITDPTFGRPDVNFSSPSDLRNFYSNKKILVENGTGKNKPLNMAASWFEHPHRRQYETLVFSPGGDVPNCYNLWKGFAVAPKQGDWSLMKAHIGDGICNGDKSNSEWLKAWMADTVQNPGMRPGTTVVLRGGRGTGKGCFATIFGRIFGNHFIHVFQQGHLTGRFNQHLKNALLVFADECFWAGDKASEGTLKGMITEPTIQIESKGKDIVTLKNHVRLIVASNESWVVPAGIDERRFLVLDVSEKHKQDRVYFNALFDQMENGGVEAMLYDLLRVDLSGFNIRAAPKTNALLDQIEHSMDTVTRFWYERLCDGTLSEHHDKWEDHIITDSFHNDYLEFANKIGKRHCLAKNAFIKALKKICPQIWKRQVVGDHYGKRPWASFFPPLEDCREHFEKELGMTVNWEETDADSTY